MRVFLIKRKGATYWANMLFDSKITFSDGNIISTGMLFFRKKDAKAYLKSVQYNEFYEVVGATVDNAKQPAKQPAEQ